MSARTNAPKRTLSDPDQDDVYDAEADVFSETVFYENLGDSLLDLAKTLFESSWWTTNVGKTPTVRAARREAQRSTASSKWVISMALGHENAAILMHEAAHIICNAWYPLEIEAHGSEFRSAELDLCLAMFGPAAADRLAASFSAWGLDLAPRRNLETPVAERGIYGIWRIGWVTGNG